MTDVIKCRCGAQIEEILDTPTSAGKFWRRAGTFEICVDDHWHEPAAGTEGDAICYCCGNHFPPVNPATKQAFCPYCFIGRMRDSGHTCKPTRPATSGASKLPQPERPEPTAKKFNCVRCDFSSDDVIEAGNHGMACPIPSLEDAYESLKQSHASLVKALEGVLGVISTERGWGTWDRMESSALYEQASEAKKIADAALDTARKVQP